MGECPERTIPPCGTSRGGRGSGEGAGFFLGPGRACQRSPPGAGAGALIRQDFCRATTDSRGRRGGRRQPSGLICDGRPGQGPVTLERGLGTRVSNERCHPPVVQGRRGARTTAVDLRASTQCIMMIVVLTESHCPPRGGCLMEKNKRPLTSRNLVVFRHTGSLGKQSPHGAAGPPTAGPSVGRPRARQEAPSCTLISSAGMGGCWANGLSD